MSQIHWASVRTSDVALHKHFAHFLLANSKREDTFCLQTQEGKFSVYNPFSHHINAAESGYKELEEQLRSLTQELSDSKAQGADLSEKLQTATQGLSTSETRLTELEAEFEEECNARLRVKSELDMLSQQPIRHVGDDSPPGSSAFLAEAAQQELQDVRLAPSAHLNVLFVLSSCNGSKFALCSNTVAFAS